MDNCTLQKKIKKSEPLLLLFHLEVISIHLQSSSMSFCEDTMLSQKN